MEQNVVLKLSSGATLPAVGLGTWQATDNEMETAMDTALRLGYRHFDTAILYENERPIGRVLNHWMEKGRIARGDLFVTTKLPPMGMYVDKVEHYLQQSLENLKLDYVDLYIIHSPNGIKQDAAGNVEEDTQVDHAAVWKILEAQVDAGLVKSIGVSNFSKEQIEGLLKTCRIPPSNLQTELHVYFQQKDLVDFCQTRGICVVAYSPLGSPGLNKFYSAYGVQKDLPNLFDNPLVVELAAKYKKSPAQIILRHTVQRGIGVIPKSTSEARLKENLDVLTYRLDQDDMDRLSQLDLGRDGQITKWETWTWVS